MLTLPNDNFEIYWCGSRSKVGQPLPRSNVHINGNQRGLQGSHQGFTGQLSQLLLCYLREKKPCCISTRSKAALESLLALPSKFRKVVLLCKCVPLQHGDVTDQGHGLRAEAVTQGRDMLEVIFPRCLGKLFHILQGDRLWQAGITCSTQLQELSSQQYKQDTSSSGSPEMDLVIGLRIYLIILLFG